MAGANLDALFMINKKTRLVRKRNKRWTGEVESRLWRIGNEAGILHAWPA